ncbi:GreA/GreB family elongation factor [Anaeromyxobacter sp. K]|nr:GreA/GreB family elongation factor [Anaeromyxobacter sp. K]
MSRTPRYITPEGFRRLAAEHARIWTELRPRIVAEVEAAAALGDRSENAEYIYGKKKLRELDRRLRFLSEKMDSLSVVEPRAHPDGRAFFGAWVTVEQEDGQERRVRLVGPDEFDVAAGSSAWTRRSAGRCSASARATWWWCTDPPAWWN